MKREELMEQLKCCTCKETKDACDFFKDKSKTTGLDIRCKSCRKLNVDLKYRRVYEKAYREKHPEKRAKIMSNWYDKNKEAHKKTQSEYRKTEGFYLNHKKHMATRRARMQNAFVEVVDYQDIYKMAEGQCFYCNLSLDFKEAEFDHYIPLSKGGLHETKNIKCSCLLCNRKKGAKMPEEVHHHLV